MNPYQFKDVQKLEKIKVKAKSKGDLKEVASCCNVLGELFQQQGKFEDAITEHKEERAVCQELDDTLGIAIAHRKIGEALNELGNYESAIKHQQKYLVLAQSLNNSLEVQRALATIGRTHFCHAEALTTNNRLLYDQALANSKLSFTKSLEFCERVKDSVSEREYMQMTCRLLLNLGLVSDLSGEDSSAINFFKKTIYITDKYSFREDLHRCHYSLALFYQRRKNYSQAKREAEMAEKVAFQMKDKALICDDLALKAQLFIIMADFESARRYLLKAYRQKTPVIQDRQRIETDLRAAIRLCKLQDMCCSLSPNDVEKLIKLYEQMGDLCSSMKAFSRAIDFYQKMLKEAKALGWKAKDLNPIYVSLSQTYMDHKDYKSAIIYYKKELEQYSDNPAEHCRTVLNIANALEEDGASYYELEPLYDEAITLADEANNPRLKATALNSLSVLQETNGYLEKSKESTVSVNQICEENGIDLDDESEMAASQTLRNDLPLEDDDVCLEDLIDDDSEEEELKSNRGKRRPKKSIEKLNVKGETALHRACIKQDLPLVRMLLQQKHKVNVRDNCGWTPLHEACNYGSVEIVDLLLEHGASVNDRGGKHCEGVTPLHDAASCGHVDVMDTLLKHGANPLAQTDHGESVYECLLKWRLRTGGDLESRLLKECLNMEQRLKESMKNANQRIPSVKEVENKQCSASSLIPEEDQPQQDSGPFPNDLEDVEELDRSASTSAQREYASAIRVIGSSAVRSTVSSATSNKRSRLHHQPALLPEDQADDEWLEDDIVIPLKKSSLKPSRRSSDFERERREPSVSSCSSVRRDESRSSNSRTKASSRSRHISVSSDDDQNDFTPEEIPPSAKRSKFSPVQIFSDESNDRPSSPIISGSKRTKRPIQLSISAFTEPLSPHSDSWTKKPAAPSQSPLQQSAQSNGMLKLHVRIKEKALLIPVESNKTVQWLSEEASRRYYNMTGLNPVLSLQTPDGAVLNGDDVVGVVLQDGDKVVAEMVKWDLQPLPERYANLCRQLDQVRLGDVESLLTNTHTCGKFSLQLPLGSFLLPVVRALRYQENLWDLNLSSSKLDDTLFSSLCEALSTLPHLIHLDLQRNSITSVGLTSLSETFPIHATAGLKKLETLKLSHNPLGDGASQPLSICLHHMTSLRTLAIESCSLSDRFLDGNFVSVLKQRHLDDVSIGWNDWSVQTVKSWLQALNLSSLKRLSFAAPASDRVGATFSSAVQDIDNCGLVHLDLSHCSLTDSCLRNLSSCFSKLSQLKTLMIKNNPRLDVDTVAELLDQCRSYSVRIEDLDFSGCCLIGEGDRCSRALESFLSWSKSLRRLALSFSRLQSNMNCVSSLADVWIQVYGDDAHVQRLTPHLLVLTSDDSVELSHSNELYRPNLS